MKFVYRRGYIEEELFYFKRGTSSQLSCNSGMVQGTGTNEIANRPLMQGPGS